MKIEKSILPHYCFFNILLCFLRNITVVIAVAIIEITFEIIEGNLKPSGACRIYPKAIKVHKIAGSNANFKNLVDFFFNNKK